MSGNIFHIISMGDAIVKGVYRIHSQFEKFVNFIDDSNNIIGLTSIKDRKSPINIIIEGLIISNIYYLFIENDFIIINNQTLPIKKESIYKSTIEFNNPNKFLFEKNLQRFKKYLLELSTQKGLPVVFDNNREYYFKSEFEKQIIKQIKLGLDKIIKNQLTDGIILIKGIGFGLTPSGDDFICGLISGLHILENLYQYNTKTIRETIYRTALSNRIISNIFLRLAFNGQFFEHFKNLILSLIYVDDEQTIFDNTKKLINIGDTSGSDIGAGFLWSLLYFNEIK